MSKQPDAPTGAALEPLFRDAPDRQATLAIASRPTCMAGDSRCAAAFQFENALRCRIDTLALFIDERASEAQREALRLIWSGQAGGFPALFATMIGEMRGIEYAPIECEIADDLAYWRAAIPGTVIAAAEALTGPMTRPGKRVQTLNAPGSEMGPGTVAIWGKATADTVEAFGFEWEWAGRSSKHIPFDWSGPKEA